MPGGDRTGPMGMGPMTGRGLGYCGGLGAPGYASGAPGWGAGFGRGFGRRFMRRPGPYFGSPRGAAPAGRWGAWQISREEELEYLKGQADMLKDELDAIRGRIGQIEAEGASDSGEEE